MSKSKILLKRKDDIKTISKSSLQGYGNFVISSMSFKPGTKVRYSLIVTELEETEVNKS